MGDCGGVDSGFVGLEDVDESVEADRLQSADETGSVHLGVFTKRHSGVADFRAIAEVELAAFFRSDHFDALKVDAEDRIADLCECFLAL